MDLNVEEAWENFRVVMSRLFVDRIFLKEKNEMKDLVVFHLFSLVVVSLHKENGLEINDVKKN